MDIFFGRHFKSLVGNLGCGVKICTGELLWAGKEGGFPSSSFPDRPFTILELQNQEIEENFMKFRMSIDGFLGSEIE